MQKRDRGRSSYVTGLVSYIEKHFPTLVTDGIYVPVSDHPPLQQLLPWDIFTQDMLRSIKFEISDDSADGLVVGEINAGEEDASGAKRYGFKLRTRDHASLIGINPDTLQPYGSSTETLGKGEGVGFSRGKEK